MQHDPESHFHLMDRATVTSYFSCLGQWVSQDCHWYPLKEIRFMAPLDTTESSI